MVRVMKHPDGGWKAKKIKFYGKKLTNEGGRKKKLKLPLTCEKLLVGKVSAVKRKARSRKCRVRCVLCVSEMV
jgi:hypothetical protein